MSGGQRDRGALMRETVLISSLLNFWDMLAAAFATSLFPYPHFPLLSSVLAAFWWIKDLADKLDVEYELLYLLDASVCHLASIKMKKST